MKKTLIIVPINEFSVAKSRLRKSFSRDAINKLVIKLSSQLLDRVESLLVEFKSVYDLAILTECNKVKSLYKSRNILYISPQKKGTLSEKVSFAERWAVKKNYKTICILPSDLANPTLEDLRDIIFFPMEENMMVICSSYNNGTNALHVTIPTNLKFSYGLNSFKKHLTIAKKNKIKTKILHLNSIQLDVDNEKDLTELTQKEPYFLDN
tara:strand:+ start:206 stop:832 length:627 start_codon:yes stop_codon:yes gene_type:complete